MLPIVPALLASALLPGDGACRDSLQVAIVNVAVIPMTDARMLHGQTVLTCGRRIVAVGRTRDVPVPREAARIDGAGRFLIPGLWDMHVHAWVRDSFAPPLLAMGVTGVREMGTGMGRSRPGGSNPFSWRDDVAAGRVIAPRVVAAGAILDGGDSTWYRYAPFFKVVQTPEQGRKWVDSLSASSADFIKVYGSLAPDVYAAIVDQARQRGLPVAGHVPAMVGVATAVRSGQRSIEHLSDLLVSTSRDETVIRDELRRALAEKHTPTAMYLRESELSARLVRTHDAGKARRLSIEMARARVTQVPTLVVQRDPRYYDARATPDTSRLASLPKMLHRFIVPTDSLTPQQRTDGAIRFALEMEMVGRLYRAGVPILPGTDLGNPWIYPGYSLHDELALLNRSGIPPLAVLRSATIGAARFLRLAADLGSIEPGKLADLVLLDADPIHDIHNTTRIREVIMDGHRLERERLDAMLRPPRP